MMQKIRKIYLFGFLFLAGCAMTTDIIQRTYEGKMSVKKGTHCHKKGLYCFGVPPNPYGYYIEEHFDKIRGIGMTLIPKGVGKYTSGTYQISAYPEDKLPAEILYDLEKSFEYIINKRLEYSRRITREADLRFIPLNSEIRNFHNKKALYKEFFVRGKDYVYAYVSLLFYNRGYLYFVNHSQPSYDLEPKIKQETIKEFEEFLKYFITEVEMIKRIKEGIRK